MEPSLFEKTLLLLATRDRSLEAIALGAEVGVSWLQKFSRRTIPNAGTVRVQRVHDYLLSLNHGKKFTPASLSTAHNRVARG